MSKFVYDFIQSLSMREKAYFKRFANTYSENKGKNYLRLYQALEHQPMYDAENLKQQFEGEKLGQHLSSESDYLLEQLLRSLVNFHTDGSSYQKLIKYTLFINILMEKGFRHKALKVLRKAKKLAYRTEEFTVVLKLIQQEEEILFREGILNFTSNLKQLKEERIRVNLQIQNLSELRLLREQARELQFTESFVTDPYKFKHIFFNPIMESEDNALSISAKEHWLYVHETCLYLTRQYEKGQRASGRFVEFMEQNTHLIKRSKIQSTLSNYLLFSALLGDETAFEKTLPKLDKMLSESPLDTNYILFIKYSRLFELYYRKENLNAVKDLEQVAGDFIQRQYKLMGETQVNYMLMLLTRACMEMGDFEKASDWLNFWNRVEPLDYTLIHNRLFALIIYYELGWHSLLEAELASAYKTLRNRKKYDRLAANFILFFKKYLKNPNGLPDALKELEYELAQIKTSPEENKAFVYYDFWKWCARKQNNLQH